MYYSCVYPNKVSYHGADSFTQPMKTETLDISVETQQSFHLQ